MNIRTFGGFRGAVDEDECSKRLATTEESVLDLGAFVLVFVARWLLIGEEGTLRALIDGETGGVDRRPRPGESEAGEGPFLSPEDPETEGAFRALGIGEGIGEDEPDVGVEDTGEDELGDGEPAARSEGRQRMELQYS